MVYRFTGLVAQLTKGGSNVTLLVRTIEHMGSQHKGL